MPLTASFVLWGLKSQTVAVKLRLTWEVRSLLLLPGFGVKGIRGAGAWGEAGVSASGWISGMLAGWFFWWSLAWILIFRFLLRMRPPHSHRPHVPSTLQPGGLSPPFGFHLSGYSVSPKYTELSYFNPALTHWENASFSDCNCCNINFHDLRSVLLLCAVRSCEVQFQFQLGTASRCVITKPAVHFLCLKVASAWGVDSVWVCVCVFREGNQYK